MTYTCGLTAYTPGSAPSPTLTGNIGNWTITNEVCVRLALCSTGKEALSHFVYIACQPMHKLLTYNFLLKILNKSLALSGLGIIA